MLPNTSISLVHAIFKLMLLLTYSRQSNSHKIIIQLDGDWLLKRKNDIIIISEDSWHTSLTEFIYDISDKGYKVIIVVPERKYEDIKNWSILMSLLINGRVFAKDVRLNLSDQEIKSWYNLFFFSNEKRKKLKMIHGNCVLFAGLTFETYLNTMLIPRK